MKKTINWTKITYNLNDDLLFLVTITAIWGSIVYYLYALNWSGIILSLILIISSFIILRHLWKNSAPTKKEDLKSSSINKTLGTKSKIYLLIYGLFYIFLVLQLFQGRSSQSLISPWQRINPSFFWIYSLASLILVLILIKKNINTPLKIILISSYYLLSLSVALIIYKIGYGFDPFIHQATMKLIASQGVVFPKTPYYLGEYSIIVIIHKISGLAIGGLNKFLVPGLTALFLPLALYRFLKKENSYFPLAILFILILGFSPFIVTTPQNLSYLFLILTVLASFNYSNLLIVWLLALATAAIHPLTGLPALTFALWISATSYQDQLKLIWSRISKLLIFILMFISLPLALVLGGGGQWQSINGKYLSFFKPLKNLISFPQAMGQEDWLSNIIYLVANNYKSLLIIAIIIALFYYYKSRKSDKDKALKDSLIVMSSALLISYLLSSQIIFSHLITYERANYAERIPIIILIFLLPFLILGLNRIIIKIRRQKGIKAIIWLIFAIGLLSISLYLSYPRWDKYWNSHGYSTSQNDLNTVRSIARNASTPYIVLADQQVSAAALQELGFNHYYHTNRGLIYFYPIPTGGPLYQYYLKMVYKNPSPNNMAGALHLVGVNTGYLVINKYWHQSDRLINEAKQSANSWWVIGNQVYIFKYNYQRLS